MKVSAREEYGLRCLLQLARQAAASNPVPVHKVAAREGLSTAYVEKLLRVLAKAGLVESIRGPRGGYRMARPPERVTVGDAIRALGGYVYPEELCVRFTGNEDCCVHQIDCGLRPLWEAVSLHIQTIFDNVPLSVLLEQEQRVVSRLQEALAAPLQSLRSRGGTL